MALIRSERGFSTVALLALLPLLLMVLAVIAGASLLLGADAEFKQECRATLLRGQDQVAKDLAELLSLNHQASALRASRAATEAAMLAAVTPPAAAALQAALAAIKAQQAILAAKQKLLFWRAKSRSRLTPMQAQIRLRETARRRAALVDIRSATVLRSKLRSAEFDVVPSPPGSETPSYEPSPRFSVRQRMSVETEWPVTAMLPTWLKTAIGGDSALKLKTSCHATIKKGERGWQSQLQADKS